MDIILVNNHYQNSYDNIHRLKKHHIYLVHYMH